MKFKHQASMILGGVFTLASMTVFADVDKQISDFAKVNSWYCEQPVNNANALRTKLETDGRLQADSAVPSIFQEQSTGSNIHLMAHQKGCTALVEVSADDKPPLNDIIQALSSRGYKKQSQNIAYSQSSGVKAMVSKTVFDRNGNEAVLLYPMEKNATQQISLTSSNYSLQNTANVKTASSDKVDMHRELAGTKGENGWYQAKSTKGNYTVMMPLKFNDFSIASDKENIRSVEMLATKSNEGIKFLASRTFYKQRGESDKVFNTFSSGEAVPNVPRKTLKFKGYDAVLIEAVDKQQGSSQLIMKVGETLMLLAVEWPLQHSKAAKQLGDAFFNSFTAEK